MDAMTANVIDVTDETFEQVVVEGSKTRPVIVDLWAAWCGPCRVIGPILEKVANERQGAFTLAKVDVDANGVGQALLNAVRSQGIPTVVAFRDGAVVDMFIGAYPEQAVNQFVDGVLPTAAEVAAHEAQEDADAGDLQEAERRYREALKADPGNRAAAVGLGKLLLDRGELEEASALVEPHLPDPEADRVARTVEVLGWSSLEGPGTLDSAKRLAAKGQWRQALDGMLGAIPEDRDAAREAMISVFAVLGDEDPLVAEYRKKLTNALF
jgi:putative thioredoxin